MMAQQLCERVAVREIMSSRSGTAQPFPSHLPGRSVICQSEWINEVCGTIVRVGVEVRSTAGESYRIFTDEATDCGIVVSGAVIIERSVVFSSGELIGIDRCGRQRRCPTVRLVHHLTGHITQRI